MAKICGIYKITSPIGRIYIGQSKDCEDRFRSYYRLKCEGQPRLYRSLKKYGVKRHDIRVIHNCDESELDALEIYYIDLFQTFNTEFGLNLKHGGHKGQYSKEARKKISDTLKNGNTHWCHNKEVSDKVRKRLKEANLGRKSPMSDEAKKKRIGINGKLIINISNGIFYYGFKEAWTAYGKGAEITFQRKMYNTRRNDTEFRYADQDSILIKIRPIIKRTYVHTEETKIIISEKGRGRKVSQQTRLKMSASNKGKLLGKPKSSEHIQKMINIRTGSKINGDLVINMQTGIFYQSVQEAWEAYGIKSDSNFRKKLNNIKINDTSFVYVE